MPPVGDHWSHFPDVGTAKALWSKILTDARRMADHNGSGRSAARAESYLHAYPALVGFFEREGGLREHDVTAGATMVYGWMPCVAVLVPEALGPATVALNEVRRRKRPTADVVRRVAAYVGDSVVAASKLLHFAVPDGYAIWDSRVALYLRRPHRPSVFEDRVSRYMAYLEVLDELRARDDFHRLPDALGRSGSAPESPLRMLERVMFTCARRDGGLAASVRGHPHRSSDGAEGPDLQPGGRRA